MRRTISEQFGVEPPSTGIPFAGRSDRAIVADLFAGAGLTFDEATWKSFVLSYLERLDHELKVCEGRLFAGVNDILNVVAAKPRVQVGLLTGNMEPAAWRKVAWSGVSEFFSFGGFGDREPLRDDIAREAQAAAEDKFGGDISQFIVIGDTPADVQCGNAIGATTIAVATGSSSFEELSQTDADLVVQELSDAREFFDAL